MKFWLVLLIMLIAFHQSVVAQQVKSGQNLPNCGKLNVIPGDVRTITPWTAAVYTQTRSKSGKMVRKFFTNGVIMGPTMILSLVGGRFGVTLREDKRKKYVVPPPESFIIGAGINSTDVDETDPVAQFVKVKWVEPTRFVDKDYDFVHAYVYHLERPLNFATPYVRHICIPWLLKHRNPTPYGWQLIQGGFAHYPSNHSGPKILKVIKVTTGPKSLCESMFRYHFQEIIPYSLCGRRDVVTSPKGVAIFAGVVDSVENKNKEAEENNFCQLHGSSLTFNFGGAWYIPVLLGMIPGRQRGRCGFKSFYVYGIGRHHLDWVGRSLACSPKFACSDSTCISVDKVCDGIRDCQDGSDEEKDFCDSQNRCNRKNKSYSCGLKDKCISTEGLCDGKRDCDNGNDENTKVCQEHKAKVSASLKTIYSGSGYCPNIEPDKGVVFKCFDASGTSVDCSKVKKSAGSKVELECDPYHISRFSHDSTHLVCNESKWIQEKPFICERSCSILNVQKKQVGLPWHVSIAVASGKDGKLEQVCSGTLIEKSFLITSTQCVTSWANNAAGAKNYSAVLNPTTSIGLKAKSSGFQILPLEHVWKSGNTPNYGLALVKLTEEARIFGENLPMIACYLFAPFKSLRTGQTGIITGFTLEGSTSSKPAVRNVTIVNRSECTGNGVTVRKKQFCVSVEEGFFPCRGDTGVGVLFKENSVYVLKGVATPGDVSRCDSKFGVVTNVDDHSDWILDVLEANS